jgi:ornithine cyclodeaminase/alanine dehydrogenase-like protein (mu-crystallin family)
MKDRTFYAIAKLCDKIVCDDWDTVKHRTQTLSRMYKEGVLKDEDIDANLTEIVIGKKPGRRHMDERIYFNAVGLAYTDIAIAYAMFQRASEAGFGQDLRIQKEMIFEHAHLKDWVHI